MKKLTSFLILACFLVSLSGTALAWNDNSEGRPNLGRGVGVPSISIWHDHRDVFHVKSTSLRGQHVFSGVIQTDGRFYDIDEKQMENGDYVKVDRDRNVIRFRLTGRGFDEFNFKIRNGKTLRFEVNRDGRDMPTQHIYIGKNGWHPRNNKFTLK